MAFSIASVNVLLGVGNELHGDDGVGVYVARHFHHEGWAVIECGTAPENYIGKVMDSTPELVVIVDAADMGLEAGAIRIIPKERMGAASLSTHSLPLSVLISHIEMGTHAHVYLIGVQPEHMRGEMSPLVKKAAHHIMAVLKKGSVEVFEVLR